MPTVRQWAFVLRCVAYFAIGLCGSRLVGNRDWLSLVALFVVVTLLPVSTRMERE